MWNEATPWLTGDRHGFGRARVAAAVLLTAMLVAWLAAVSVTVLPASPASASVAPGSPVVAQAEGEELDIDGDDGVVRNRFEDEQDKIDQVVLMLLILAVLTSVLTLLYWRHTNPHRRAAALERRGIRRAERRDRRDDRRDSRDRTEQNHGHAR